MCCCRSSNGGVYVIPSASALTGTFMLANAESQPVAATLVQLANPFTSSPAFLGASVSGREPFLPYSTTTTADSDRIDDFIIGAPGYSITNGRTLDGGVLILQGAFFPLLVPVSTAITTQIGVGQAFSAPFSVTATTPANLDIFVFSNRTISPPFDPVTDIDPATVVVNGVAFPNATIRTDPVDENNDGIPDAIITITPRSNLGLSSTTTTLTISSRTLVTSPNNANKSWSGTAAIIVTGAPGPVPTPTPGPGLVLPIGTFVPTSFVPPFGPDHLVPPPSVLSRLDYKAIPLHVAQNQYLPTPGFGVRTFDYVHPGATHPRNGAATGFAFQKRPIKTTLANSIYTPSKFPTGKTVAFTHKVRVIPTNRQREVYRPTPLLKKHPTNRP